MRSLLLAVLAIAFLARPARAENRRQAAFNGITLLAAETALVLDGLQTFDIKHHPDRHEGNPLLGPHPGDTAIVGYFAATMLITAGAWYLLPSRYRVLVPVVVLAFEVPQVSRNIQVGASMVLPF